MGGFVKEVFEVNPARAGMIPMASYPQAWDSRKPRASGDDPPLVRPPSRPGR